ncbi:MAG: HAD-IIB family hydrolase [Nitrospirae bacterium]|nr:HAD-IIB family hydrolase [Nitrospirota bacterium]
MMPNIIIITDLDGTLLHPTTYSFDAARPALKLIRECGVPLILCSSKTRAELEVWRDRLENRHPFIAENGGGIFIPEGYFPFPLEGKTRSGYRVISLGMPYAGVREQFIRLRDTLQIPLTGFGDMTPAGVAALTGLSLDEAVLAKQREYGEPFVFPGATDERVLQAIEASGLRWTQGRLFHLMGNHHKGKAVALLRTLYERAKGPLSIVGLGDSLNDLPFLLAVDHPVLVRRKDGSHDPRIDIPGLYRTKKIGPAGWNEAVHKLMGTGSGIMR